ncbi:SDR family oxidoreductase [Haloechinothrix halophila]|uniref:SDR family oxidoreductase n=1 Tax=Haloechinothrix halophila TaxID=1069073 RepID=UPI00041F034F|nr:SDR family oxidoreductase [Haloechinothrix halophila]
MDVQGKGVVITGAGHGIGRAFAHRFAAEGARVVVNDIDADAAMTVASEVDGHAVPGDAASDDGVGALIDAARDHLGAIDVYCANAGVAVGAGLDAPESDWTKAIEVNTLAHVRAARRLVPGWLESGGGTFVVTASAAGLLTMLGSPTYSVTKHGAVAFAEWLSVTYGHRGIAVHCVCPQGVQTQMLDDSGVFKDMLSQDTALTPEQVADSLWQGMTDGSFLVLPHPEAAKYYAYRAAKPEKWHAAMRELQRGFDDAGGQR